LINVTPVPPPLITPPEREPVCDPLSHPEREPDSKPVSAMLLNEADAPEIEIIAPIPVAISNDEKTLLNIVQPLREMWEIRESG
jgi:hypothetical protein